MGSHGGYECVDELDAAVDKLKGKLDRNLGQVEAWCEVERSKAERVEKQALDRLEELKGRIESLRHENDELLSLGYANERLCEAERKKVTDLQGCLEVLRTEESAVENEMNLANDNKAAILKSLEEKQAVADKISEQHDHQINQLTRGAKLYKKLGLEFQRVGKSRLKLSFTQIDPRDYERLFFFVIFVDQNDCYHVEQVEPSIGNISEMVQNLNSSNDFAKFVRDMRSRFQAIAT
mmetsp:Transcript_25003/g.40580  ORF Transcript_25003/g.40580 Transcript_25003/m.40580 type:complete len:236 (+) Transcript_25003:149-856(+)|eukprot:CAMPEP_0203767072 /NCGR_PEP_ID=MMETSP0099_2-20121227/785_1 /ASSEMBLY_ACC=CAM_ASM_000209 /TAXON_ID=96639 /ORGANISM=" , Strain NY0313808BC1" /LENGTH=235 /DNA_ID=CAMNT_0050663523 /DNA_START=253 /DNA_END=960 /DNA_ORIENTATION=-